MFALQEMTRGSLKMAFLNSTYKFKLTDNFTVSCYAN